MKITTCKKKKGKLTCKSNNIQCCAGKPGKHIDSPQVLRRRGLNPLGFGCIYERQPNIAQLMFERGIY